MAMILDAFIGNCIDRLAAFVQEEVILVLGVDDELKRLLRRLRRIRSVLKDAERRRIEDDAVNDWLNDLKGVMYDADDILDLCRLEGSRLLAYQPNKSHKSSSSASPVRSHFSLLSYFTSVPCHHEIGQRIKNLNDRLEEISKDKLMFTLEQARTDDIRLGGVNLRQTSPMDEYIVVGRDINNATNRLVELIVREDKRKCRVFAIVGMGGIGKTTLAQKVFNVPRLDSNFQLRVWVCVSQSFSEINLLKQIIRSAGGDHGDAQTKAELLPMLRTVVKGKQLFVVLDDVWRADVWVDLLRNPLHTGPASCSIIVTTRNDNVARMMGAVYVHRVEELPIEFGWELLCRRVFIDGEEEEIQTLKDVGIKIVEKCHGLPLAIKTIAGVLSTKDRKREEWENVLKSNAWSMSQLPEELRGALYLSYEDLPSQLKQCFLYLSVFPEDYEYDLMYVVGYWIAEGLVERQENLLEDTAEEYYRELIRRNLLHPHPDYYDQNVCTMHDLLRSLACFLSRNECFCGDVEGMRTSLTAGFRRLFIAENTGEGAVLTESIIQQKGLRALWLLDNNALTIGRDIISRLGFLRVLVLNGKGIDFVPDCIGDLMHMRYLNLDNTRVSQLPESLGRLTNLQFLYLQGCKSLRTLPEGITRLCNLRYLSIIDTPLNHVPKEIGKLQQLNHLLGVVLGEDGTIEGEPPQGCDFDNLQNLSQLRRLSIWRLEKASTGMSALQNKSNIKILDLNCSQQTLRQPYTKEEMDRIFQILNELIPPPCLQWLTLDGFFGHNYPRWMASSLLRTSLPHLTLIRLENLMTCPQVPPLGELPQLRYINITGASAVVTIGHEFIGAGVREGTHELTSTAFPKLEYLAFQQMANWEEWSLGRETAEQEEKETAAGESRLENRSLVLFPRLQRLVLKDCPKLQALPQGLEQAVALQKLIIDRAYSLNRVEDIPSLLELRLINNNSLEMISDLPKLKLMAITNCSALKSVRSLNALQELQLRDDKMECLPEWLIQVLQQRLQTEDISSFRMDLCCNAGVVRRCLRDGPDWPIIQQIPQMDAHTKDGSAYLHYTKDPFSYTTNL